MVHLPIGDEGISPVCQESFKLIRMTTGSIPMHLLCLCYCDKLPEKNIKKKGIRYFGSQLQLHSPLSLEKLAQKSVHILVHSNMTDL